MAEQTGFEPADAVKRLRVSNPLPSTRLGHCSAEDQRLSGVLGLGDGDGEDDELGEQRTTA